MTAASDEAMATTPFPFIVGVGRSGTTLLRAILDSHPDMAIPGESHFIPEFVGHARRYGQRGAFLWERFLLDLARHPRFRMWGLPEDRVLTLFRQEPPASFAAAFRRLYALFAEVRGKARYGDKTPAYVNRMPMLARLFPEASFIHLVRDGRDVALSRLDHPTMSASPLELAILWKRGVEKGRRAGRGLGPGRYLEIRYEDLVEEPEALTRSVCSFINLAFDPGMLRYHERADEIIRPTQHPRSHARIRLPPIGGLRDWRTQMPPADVKTFDVVAGGLLEELGYERRLDPRRMAHRVTIRRRQLGLRTRRAMRALRKRVGSGRRVAGRS
jgi:hypothetical protein